jgi:hypothetical protein
MHYAHDWLYITPNFNGIGLMPKKHGQCIQIIQSYSSKGTQKHTPVCQKKRSQQIGSLQPILSSPLISPQKVLEQNRQLVEQAVATGLQEGKG